MRSARTYPSLAASIGGAWIAWIAFAVATPAQNPPVGGSQAVRQFDELTAVPTDGAATTDLVFGDFDGDGDPDLFVANDGQDRLLLNDGRGVFADFSAGRLPAADTETRASVVGDLDGDGDLVLASPVQDRLLVNDGAASFRDVTATRMPVGGGADALALGDVDGDGDLDLIVGNGRMEWDAVGAQNRL